MKKLLFFLIIPLLIFGCNKNRKAANEVLALAKNNKTELEKVINHYKNKGDKEKLEAAYYLIINMKDKFSLEGKPLDIYFKIYEDILNLYNSGITDNDILDSITEVKIDSLEAYYGKITYDKLEKKYDIFSLKSDFLIKNIDLAFEVWKTKPWAKHITFNQFCEYILPYRGLNEPMQDWRPFLYNKYKFLADSLKNPKDPKEITHKICDYIYRDWKHLDNFSKASYLPGIIDIDHYKAGICEHHYLYLTTLLRSFGIAVAMENTPQWRNYPGAHSWLMLIDTTGKEIAFNPGNPKFTYIHKVPMGSTGSTTKVYRRSFTIQKSLLLLNADKNEIFPSMFSTPDQYDVSWQYTYPQADVTLTIDTTNTKHVYLSSYSYAYTCDPVAWAEVKHKQAVFKNMGYPAVYLSIYFDNNIEMPLNNPIAIDSLKNIRILTPDTNHKITVILKSKFPMSDSMVLFSNEMIGARFQASNSPDFTNAMDLYTIKGITDCFEEKEITNTGKYRYIRYLSTNKGRINIAEIEFYSKDRLNHDKILKGKVIGEGKTLKWKRSNVFDNDISTNLSSVPGSWVGLDLGRPEQIIKVRYLPRNDLNIVEVGDLYELLYFNMEWYSCGRKIADKNYLVYNNVPKNALFVLRDLSKGKEERIFTYENGKQVWW